MRVLSYYTSAPRGLHCGGVEDGALHPPQAENPASRILCNRRDLVKLMRESYFLKHKRVAQEAVAA